MRKVESEGVSSSKEMSTEKRCGSGSQLGTGSVIGSDCFAGVSTSMSDAKVWNMGSRLERPSRANSERWKSLVAVNTSLLEVSSIQDACFRSSHDACATSE